MRYTRSSAGTGIAAAGAVDRRSVGTRWVATLVALAALLILAVPAAAQQVTAIVNGTVYPVAGAPIDKGTVLIRGSEIVAVGANVPIPSGARVVNAAGKVVTPGFLNSHTQLGAIEIGGVAGTRDEEVSNDYFTAAFDVTDGINPYSTWIPITRVEGITRAVVAPTAGVSILAGQGALIELMGERTSDMVVERPVAMFAVLGESGAERSGGARGAAVLRLREALEDARDYANNRAAWETNRRREYSLSRLDLDALVPVVRGEVPLAIHVDRASDILTALDVADDYDLRLVLLGAAEGHIVAEEIAAAGVPVILNPMVNIPQFDQLGASLENPVRLHEAGVEIAFATFESEDPMDPRKLMQAAGNAIAYGMPAEAALRAVTLAPARIWGIAGEYGTLEPGKDADVVVWSGDPFELLTRVEHVFIEGREVPDWSRQKMLVERYVDLDGLYPPAYDDVPERAETP